MTDARTRAAVEAVIRMESARLIAGLARYTRDVGLAEDLAQDAVVAALEHAACNHGLMTGAAGPASAEGSFAQRFAAVRAAHGPLVFGLDPAAELLEAWGLGDSPDGLDRFADIALAAAGGTTGIVKPQSAFFERHGWRGIRTLQRLIATARAAGLLVILDIKRGDVGSTNDAYAQAYLGESAPLAADAITVHPYLGLGAMGTFVSRAAESGSCLLVVTRSSNPEGRAIQAGAEQRLLAGIGTLNTALAPGAIGPVGAVVGPTRIEPELDLAAANCLFLAPGVGAQGASPADVARVFAACPERVMPSASRLLLAAGPDTGRLREAVSALAAEFRALLG